MTQQDKELLLKDLCARLPYHPILNWKFIDNTSKDEELKELSDLYIWWITKAQDCEVKPYLRPMSSMTEEEFEKLEEYSGLVYDQLDLASFQDGAYKCLDFYLNEIPADIVILVFDWLNAHQFDYRGLIEKDLALKAKYGMYYE